MVLTGAVLMSEAVHTRRRLLGAGAGVTTAAALAGCGLLGDDDEPDQPAAPDPLRPLLDEALALALAYDRAALARPDLAARLTPLAADHRAHVTELTRVIGSAPPSAAAPSAVPGVAELRAAEQAAQKTAAAACGTAPPERAGLAGSIAACRATHVEALR